MDEVLQSIIILVAILIGVCLFVGATYTVIINYMVRHTAMGDDVGGIGADGGGGVVDSPFSLVLVLGGDSPYLRLSPERKKIIDELRRSAIEFCLKDYSMILERGRFTRQISIHDHLDKLEEGTATQPSRTSEKLLSDANTTNGDHRIKENINTAGNKGTVCHDGVGEIAKTVGDSNVENSNDSTISYDKNDQNQLANQPSLQHTQNTQNAINMNNTHISVPFPGQSVATSNSSNGDNIMNLRAVPVICAICLTEYEPTTTTNNNKNTATNSSNTAPTNIVCWSSNPNCTHVFHKQCISQWLDSLGRSKMKHDPILMGDSMSVNHGVNKRNVLNYDLECPCCRQEFVSKEVLNALYGDHDGSERELKGGS